MAIWYEIEKTVDGINAALECNYDFHDFRLERIAYIAKKDSIEILLMYDSGNEGVLLRCAHVKDAHVCGESDYYADWLGACGIFLLNDETLLFVVGAEPENPPYSDLDNLKRGSTWIRAERIFWALTDKDGTPVELPKDRIDDIWYEYGKPVEKHFELKEFQGNWKDILCPPW